MFPTPSSRRAIPPLSPIHEDKIMKSTKCVECGFVGWSDENCKACGAPLGQRSNYLPSPAPVNNSNYDQSDQEEGPKKGLALAALILGIVGFFTAGLVGVGA